MAEDKEKPDIGAEISRMPVEPLLPVEKRLIAWSLITGAVLLFVLLWIGNTYFPAGR